MGDLVFHQSEKNKSACPEECLRTHKDVLLIKERMPHKVEEVECISKMNTLEKNVTKSIEVLGVKVNNIYIYTAAVTATVSSIFSFSAVILGFYLKAKGMF